MKVKISYTIDLENVPSEMDQLILRAEKNLETAASICSHLIGIKERSMENALKRMEQIRVHMMEADIVLEDSMAIASGYLQALAGEGVQSDTPPANKIDFEEEDSG